MSVDLLKKFAAHSFPQKVLHEEMVALAARLCTLPVGIDYERWPVEQLSRLTCRAIHEHVAAKRINCYDLADNDPGAIYLEPTGYLLKWWVEATAKDAPETDTVGQRQPPSAGYLGLIVDEASGEVRREGIVNLGGQMKVVYFKTCAADWRTFLVAYRAGERGATESEWKKGYPGDWTERRRRKNYAKNKLMPLGVTFEKRSLKLILL